MGFADAMLNATLTGALIGNSIEKTKDEQSKAMSTMTLSSNKSIITGICVKDLFLNSFEDEDIFLQLSAPTGMRNHDGYDLVFAECITVQDYKKETIKILPNEHFFQKHFENSRFALLTWSEIVYLEKFNRDNNKEYIITKIYTEPYLKNSGKEYFLCEISYPSIAE